MKIDQFNFAGKKAIVRVDFNVPLDENGNVTDDTRIRGALPTLKKVLADGGALIMMSHMGKPKGKVNLELPQKGHFREALRDLRAFPRIFRYVCAPSRVPPPKHRRL